MVAAARPLLYLSHMGRIPVHRAEAERSSVVKAPSSDRERELFDKLQQALGAGSVSDLIRYAVARLAIEEGKGELIPDSWMMHYPEAHEQKMDDQKKRLLQEALKGLPLLPPATQALPREASALRIGPRLTNEPDYRLDE